MSAPAFGEMIRRGRETARISQARVAELIGRSPSTVRAWEHGRSRPSDRSYVKAIAAVLGLEETELMEAAGFDPPDGARFRPTIEQELLSLATEKTVMVPVVDTKLPLLPSPFDRAPDKVEDEPAEVVRTEDLEVDLQIDTEVVPPPPSAGFNGSAKRSRKVTTLPAPAPLLVQAPSYLEDQEEKEFYWRRWAMTGVSILFMVVVFIWAFEQARGAVGEFISDFFSFFDI